MLRISSLVKTAPSEPGALESYRAHCECGAVIHSSMETLAREGVHAHRAWHASKARKGGQS